MGRTALRADRRSTLVEEIADRLIGSILSGKFKFGDQLPPERELARYMNVGRPTLREAIRILSVVGLVEVRHGDGTFVVDRHSDFVMRAFSWAVLLDSQPVDNLVETRIGLETELARLAALRVTNAEIDELVTLVDTMAQTLGDNRRFSEADLRFHLTIAAAARSLTLARVLNAVQSLLKQWIVRALEVPSSYERALDQHRAILAALIDRDQGRAAAAMRLHLEHMGDVFNQRNAEHRSRQERAGRRPTNPTGSHLPPPEGTRPDAGG